MDRGDRDAAWEGSGESVPHYATELIAAWSYWRIDGIATPDSKAGSAAYAMDLLAPRSNASRP
jgi:hypothetical protein